MSRSPPTGAWRWTLVIWALIAGLATLAACGGGGATDSIPVEVRILGAARVETGTSARWQSDLASANPATRFAWDFGDGKGEVNDAAPMHTYASPGSYTIRLTLTLVNGEQRTASQRVQVGAFARLEGRTCSGPDLSGWCWQRPLPFARDLLDATFVDAQHGWAVGPGPTILATADGGSTWVAQTVPTAEQVAASVEPALDRLDLVRFLDGRTGVAASTLTGRLLRTTDGGAAWLPLANAGMASIGQLWVLDAQTLVLSGVLSPNPLGAQIEHGTRVSVDGGQSWRGAAAMVSAVTAGHTLWSLPLGQQVAVSRDLGLSFETVGPSPPPPPPFIVGGMPPPSWTLTRPASVDDTELVLQVSGSQPLLRLADQGRRSSTVASTFPMGSELMGLAYGGAANEAWATFRFEGPDPETNTRPWQRARSTNGGGSWMLVGSPWAAEAPLDQMFRIDGTGWLLASSGLAAWSFADGSAESANLMLPERGRDLGKVARNGSLMFAGFGFPRDRWYTTTDGGAKWALLPGGQVDNSVWRIVGLWFFDAQRGLATSEGAWMRTDDGGRTWTAAAWSPPTPNVNLHFTPDGSGWGTYGDQLLHSTDRGAHWQAVAIPRGSLTQVQFIDANRGWVQVHACDFSGDFSGCKYELHATLDGGQTWAVRSLPSQSVSLWRFADAQAGVIVGYDSRSAQVVCWATTDGGSTWAASSVPPSASVGGFFGLKFLDARNGWVLLAGGDSAFNKTTTSLLRTRDGGRSWVDLGRLPTGARLHDFAFANANDGWIVGAGGLVLRTRDGGDHWQVQATQAGSGRDLNVVVAVDAATVWIGGERGTILSSSTGGD